MELSKRLYAVASLVTEGASVADIGTDHGYIPIYLTEQKIASKVIALDINKGPLERARMHIIGHGLKDQIETRLSDGLKAVDPGEVDTMIAAGMGGGLVIKILEEGKDVVDQLYTCILQPQSEIQRVREYLATNHLKIIAEDMVEEDGKFYPMMKVVHGVNVFMEDACCSRDILSWKNTFTGRWQLEKVYFVSWKKEKTVRVQPLEWKRCEKKLS